MVTSSTHHCDLLVSLQGSKGTLKFPWPEAGLVDDWEVGELLASRGGGCGWAAVKAPPQLARQNLVPEF